MRTGQMMTLVVFLLSGMTLAQNSPLERWTTNLIFGSTAATTDIAIIDDIDGDGVREIVLAKKHGPDVTSPSPLAIHSGRTGAILTFISYFGIPDFAIRGHGQSVCEVDDIDGDGFRDVAVAYYTPRLGDNLIRCDLHIFSTTSGNLLRTIEGGLGDESRSTQIFSTRDLDQNGVRDIAIPSNRINNLADPEAGILFVDADTGLQTARIPAPRNSFDGCGIVEIKDVNGDSVPDLLAVFGSSLTQHATIVTYSGIDLSPISNRTLGPEVVGGASQIRNLGDRNRDGFDDILLPIVLVGPPSQGSGWQIFDSSSLATLSTSEEPHGLSYVKGQLGNLGDADGDGIDDWFVLDSDGSLDSIRSGRFDNKITRWRGTTTYEDIDMVAAGLDINGDGISEIIIGKGDEISVVSLVGERRYELIAGSMEMSFSAQPEAGNSQAEISISGGPPGSPGIVGLSLFPATPQIGAFPRIVISLDPQVFIGVAEFGFDALGQARFPLSYKIPALEGVSIFMQAFYPLGSGGIVSNGLEVRFAGDAAGITNITPEFAVSGDLITVNAIGLSSESTLEIDGQVIPSTIVGDPPTLQFVAPVLDYDTEIVVLDSPSGTFRGRFNPGPIFTSVTNSETPGELLINGNGFVAGTTVMINGFPATIVSTTGFTQIRVVNTPSTGPGPVPVNVMVPGGPLGLGRTLSRFITYGEPSLTSVVDSGNPGEVLINGTGLVGGTTVTINGFATTIVDSIGATQLRVTLPPSTGPGPVPVNVVTPVTPTQPSRTFSSVYIYDS